MAIELYFHTRTAVLGGSYGSMTPMSRSYLLLLVSAPAVTALQPLRLLRSSRLPRAVAVATEPSARSTGVPVLDAVLLSGRAAVEQSTGRGGESSGSGRPERADDVDSGCSFR